MVAVFLTYKYGIAAKSSAVYNVTCPLVVPLAVEVTFFLDNPVVCSIPVDVPVFVNVAVVDKDNSSVKRYVLFIVTVAVVVAILFYYLCASCLYLVLPFSL